jgi:NitT/TauT family transport system substrate-binding protein
MKATSDKGRDRLSRRRFVVNTSTFGAASLLGLSRPVASEPQLETTKIRIVSAPATCFAPLYLAEELLHLEGSGCVNVR